MITLKSPREIEAMRRSGDLLASIHLKLKDIIKPGITTLEIDKFVEKEIRAGGGIPEQIGFEGYEYATCQSLNEEICHGFPTKIPLKDGDILTVDTVINLNGAISDSAWSYLVGEVSDETKHLYEVAYEALYKGIDQAVIGNRIGDIGHAIQSYVAPQGLSVVREFVGHGVGPTMHEAPDVPAYGLAGKGMRLKEGMVITIEPMINTGDWRSKMGLNGWTATTIDGGLSCQFEHTLAITKEGPVILTDQGERKLS